MSYEGSIAILSRGEWCAGLGDWLYQQDANRFYLIRPEGNQIARQRNEAAERMKGDYIVYVDADCVPPLKTIDRLASHDVGVVGGVVLDRKHPSFICAIKSLEPWQRYLRTEMPHSWKISPVVGVGTGCLLVRRYVFEKMEPPYFRTGDLVQDMLTEDTSFCLRAAAAGFPIYIDPAVRVGHVVKGTLYPGDEGELMMEWEAQTWRTPLAEIGDVE